MHLQKSVLEAQPPNLPLHQKNKKMMRKIAVIGVNKRERLVITKALSYIAGYETVCKTDYAIQAIRYGLNQDIKACKWQELFVYVFSSFSERIMIEQHYDQYISNGSVLFELAMAKTILNAQTADRRFLKEKAAMLAGAEKIITDYAKRQYDGVVYVENSMEKEDVFSRELDGCIQSLILGHEAVYQFRQDSLLADMLENISAEMKISALVSSQTALKKAEDDFLP
jgi:hypothetical protein